MNLRSLIYRIKKEPIRNLIIRRYGECLSRFFSRSDYNLQSKMDIDSRSKWFKPEFVSEIGGFFPTNDNQKRMIEDTEPWDTVRRDEIILLLRYVIENKIVGDLAELGVYKGLTARLIHQYCPDKKLILFDTFSGFTDRGTSKEAEKTGDKISKDQFSDTSVELVKKIIKGNDNVSFHKGYFPDSLPKDFNSHEFAFVHLDADLFDPTLSGLKHFYPLVSKGGIILVHDYNAWIGARKAVDQFFSDKPEKPLPLPDKSGSAVIIKQ